MTNNQTRYAAFKEHLKKLTHRMGFGAAIECGTEPAVLFDTAFDCIKATSNRHTAYDHFFDLFKSAFQGKLSSHQLQHTRQLFRLIVTRDIAWSAYNNQQDDLIESFKTTQFNTHWMGDDFKLLEKMLLLFGLFRAAYYIRKRYYTYLRHRYSPLKKTQPDYVKMLIETGEFYTMRASKAAKLFAVLNAEPHEQLLYWDYLYWGHYKATLNNTDEADTAFINLLRGKKIAIVGPAYTTATKQGDIDGNDLIFVTGYKGASLDDSKQHKGSRVDGCYYGDFNTQRYLDGENGERNQFLYDLKAICFKSRSAADTFRMHGYGGVVRAFLKNKLYLNGSPKMIQNMLIDMLCATPSQVNVYNMNLFLGKKPYFNAYLPTEQQEAKGVAAGVGSHPQLAWQRGHLGTIAFSHHNVIDNFLFMRLLSRMPSVNYDAELTTVISMDAEDYVAELERTYMAEYLGR